MRCRVMVATPRNVAALRGRAYLTVKEASMARREGDELQWVGKCSVWERECETGLTTMH